MSLEIVHLRNLMRLILADRRLETRLLRANIRAELDRQEQQEGDENEGRDFYVPFWADAKAHVRGVSNLRTETARRVAASRQRRRLYPLLTDGFLTWWEDRRRRRNEPFTLLDRQVRGRCLLEGLGTVKVENNLAFQIGDDGLRIVYPYFFDEPELNADTARVGLWLMSQALPNFAVADMRILDVARGTSYSVEDFPLNGGEEADLRAEYQRLIDRWRELRATYE